MSVAGPRAAHRPSRRRQILDAAVGVFATKGYNTATVADIAAACDMAPAAVYYHFAGKEEVLAEAVEGIAEQIDQVTAAGAARNADLGDVVRAVYEWADAHPTEAQLFFLWSAGATPEVAEIRRRFVDRHVHDARRYVPAGPRPAGSGSRALDRLAARTAIATAIATSVAWLSGDVLPPRSTAAEVAAALTTVMSRLVELGQAE